ncbi:MAG: hypothetical protein AMXMBFR58_08230 [Phycisphaerae bacterium]
MIAKSRTSTRSNASVLLTGVATLVLAGVARAEVVVHDNRDGTFQWTRTVYLGDGNPMYGAYLDIRQSPLQSGDAGSGKLLNWFSYGYTGSSPGLFLLVGESGAEVAWHDGFKEYTWNGETVSTIPLREYEDTEFVASNSTWDHWGMHFWALPFSFDFAGGTPLIEPLAYLGVRIKTGVNSYNYGWILFEDWTNPIMWAYETTPNTPIQISVPTPGPFTLASAASCVVLAGRRRA